MKNYYLGNCSKYIYWTNVPVTMKQWKIYQINIHFPYTKKINVIIQKYILNPIDYQKLS